MEEKVAGISPEGTVVFHGEPNGRKLFNEVVQELERLLVFAHPAISRFIAMFIFQTYFQSLFRNVFYIGVVGTKGTGKTTVLEIIRELSWRGQVIGPGSSPAAIARTLNDGCTLCIDEIDEMQGESKELCEAILRQGYRENSSSILKWDMANKKKEVINPFGPKAISFRGAIDDALSSRVYKVPSIQLKGDFVDRVLDNMGRDERDMKTILEAFVDIRKKDDNWTKERVDDLMLRPDFREKVRSVLPKSSTPRDAELAAIFLATAEIVGIDLIDELRAVVSSQKDLESDTEDDLGEVVKSIWGDDGKPPYVRIKDLRAKVNERRKAAGDKGIGPERFRRYLRDLGFRDGMEMKRVPHDGRYAVYFTEFAVKCISPTDSPDESITSLFSFNGVATSPAAGETSPGPVKSQDERVKLLRERGEVLINIKQSLQMRS